MNEIHIGKMIKQKRLELGYTQEKLCEGICEPMSISRIERGLQNPSKNMLDALSQRLGLPTERCFFFLSKNEQIISDLKIEITSCNTLKNYKMGLKKIIELENIIDPKDSLMRQFILRSKALSGKIHNDQIIPYTPYEKLDMLFQAIHLTVPNFNIDEIDKGLYCIDEIKVINHIALVYSELGENKKAIDIYHQLLKYIKKHFQNILQSGGLLPLVCYNYARELDIVGRYEDAIEIGSLGWKSCVKYGQYRYLPSIIALMAECFHFLNLDEKSKEYYRQAYYIYKAIDNEKSISVIQSEVQKYFGSNFVF